MCIILYVCFKQKNDKRKVIKMISQNLTITDPIGLHMRPAAVFASEMGKFQCNVTIIFNGSRIDAKSILNIMTACIKCGSEIVLECDGPDEAEAAQKARELINTNTNS